LFDNEFAEKVQFCNEITKLIPCKLELRPLSLCKTRLVLHRLLQFFALRARTLCVRQNCGFQAVAVAIEPAKPGEPEVLQEFLTLWRKPPFCKFLYYKELRFSP
jgi:hypothetical protein